MSQHEGNGVGTTLLAFTLGALIGGGVALLTAPRSGAETRKKMQDKLDETRGKLNDLTRDAEERVKKAVQEGMDRMEEKAELIKKSVKAGKEAMEAEKAKQAKKAEQANA